MIYHIESIIDLHEHTQNVLQNWQNTPNNFLPTHTFDDPTSTRFRFLTHSLQIHYFSSVHLFFFLLIFGSFTKIICVNLCSSRLIFISGKLLSTHYMYVCV